MNIKDFFKSDFDLPNYTVTYGLFTDPNKYRWNSLKNPYDHLNADTTKGDAQLFIVHNKPCFSSLGSYLKKDTLAKSNRIVYYFKPHVKVTVKEQLRWLVLAKQHGLIPRYINIKQVVKKKCVIMDFGSITFNLLYAYLSTVRMIVEDPQYLKNVLVMVDKYKIDYFVATVAATYLGFRNYGHSFFQPGNTYPATPDAVNLKKVQLKTVLGVYRFIQQGGPMGQYAKNAKSFCATHTVNLLSSTAKLLTLSTLVGIDFKPVLTAATDKEAEAVLAKILEV